MSEFCDNLKKLLENSGVYIAEPWFHAGGKIWAKSHKGGNTFFADVRGWGYLIGHGSGALGLGIEEAVDIQDKIWGPLLASVPELIRKLEETEKENERLKKLVESKEFTQKE